MCLQAAGGQSASVELSEDDPFLQAGNSGTLCYRFEVWQPGGNIVLVCWHCLECACLQGDVVGRDTNTGLFTVEPDMTCR